MSYIFLLKKIYKEYRGESAALGHFSVSIFFGQAHNKESKNKYSSIEVQLFGSIVNFFSLVS